MDKILTAFCYTDIHNQQSMLDYPATVRKSLVLASELAREEFACGEEFDAPFSFIDYERVR